VRRTLIAGAIGIAAGACYTAPAPGQYSLVLRAHSDDGAPLAGVEFRGNGTRLGTTGAAGTVTASLVAREGTVMTVRAHCPDGFRSPERPHLLTLRRFEGLRESSAGRLDVTAECRPTQRRGVVVVRAAGQPDLPVLMHGSEVARTDRHGVAHMLVALAPHSSFRVEIETSKRPRLRPQNPVATFTMRDEDDLFLFDPEFTEKRKKRKPRKKRRPPELPVEIILDRPPRR
jgi:hypothetical protein